MKKQQKEELRAKTVEELEKEVRSREEEAVKLGADIKMFRVKDTCVLRKKLDEIAVIKTILQEKKGQA
ncbi:MAG: hypothetical protein ACOX50_05040 [Patescibacteria group bacterium]|jgi:ribosomal protein L29